MMNNFGSMIIGILMKIAHAASEVATFILEIRQFL